MLSFIHEVASFCYKKGWYHGKSFSSLRKVVLCVWRKRLFIIFVDVSEESLTFLRRPSASYTSLMRITNVKLNEKEEGGIFDECECFYQ